MDRFIWVIKNIGKDIKDNLGKVFKMILLAVAILTFMKVMASFGLEDLAYPIVVLLIPIIGIYTWYSMEYDMEQKKIIRKIKGGK